MEVNKIVIAYSEEKRLLWHEYIRRTRGEKMDTRVTGRRKRS